MGTISDKEIRAFVRAAIATALWSETDPGTGEPLEDHYRESSLTDEAREDLEADARAFLERPGVREAIGRRLTDAGHDWWLTRCGHGAGFWDGGWPAAGERLTEAARASGAAMLDPDDEGQLHYLGGGA